jgi:hypothetical protein
MPIMGLLLVLASLIPLCATAKPPKPNFIITIADHLKTLGYATACIGSWHLGHYPETLPQAQSFDSYFDIPYSNDMNHPDKVAELTAPLAVEKKAGKRKLCNCCGSRRIELRAIQCGPQSRAHHGNSRAQNPGTA